MNKYKFEEKTIEDAINSALKELNINEENLIIIDKVEKREFREFLMEQREEYNEILKESEHLFDAYGMKEKELGTMTKVNSKVMSEVKLMTNDSDEVVAKMMMEGTNKGIIKINKAINENNVEDEEALKLAQKLIKVMEHNLDELKIYL